MYSVPLSLPSDPKDIPSYIVNFVTTWDTSKSTQTALSIISENFYTGIHWVFFDLVDGVVKGEPEVINDGGAIRNYYKLVFDAVLSLLTREQYMPTAITTSGLPSRQRSANLTTAFARDVKRRNGGPVKDKRRMLATLLRADSIVRCEIDEDSLDDLYCDADQLNVIINQYGQSPARVEQVGNDKYLARFKMGHIKEVDVNSSCVVVPSGVLDFNDPSQCRQFAVVEFLPIQTIRMLAEKFGADPDQVAPVISYDYRSIGLSQMAVSGNSAYGYDKRANNQRGYMLDARGMTGKLCSYWEADSNGNWTCIYTCNYGLDYYLGGEGNLPFHPYVKFSSWSTPSSLWSMGHGDDLIRPQRSINKMRAAAMRHYQRMLKDIILKPHGSRMENFTASLGTTIAEFDPARGIPQRLSADYGQLQYFQGQLDFQVAEIFRLGKVNPVVQGILPPRTAHDTYEEAIKRNAQELQPLLTETFNADSILRQKEVMLAKHSGLFDKSRLGNLLLPDGTTYYDDYCDADLMETDFEYKPEPVGLQTPEDRYEQITNLMQMGLFAEGPEFDAMRRRVRDFTATGNIGAMEPEVEAYAKIQASKNIALIKTNKVAVVQTEQPVETPQGTAFEKVPIVVGPSGEVLYQEWMIHYIMIDQYSKFVQNPQTTEDQRQIALLLLDMHQEAESRNAEAAKKQQLKDTAEQMQAEAAGNVLTAAISAEANAVSKGLKTSRQGGLQSGRVRAMA